jgi:multidrug efflux system membrane fusion protein
MPNAMKKILLLSLTVALGFVGCREAPKMPERVFPVRVGKVIEQDTPIYFEIIGNVLAPRIVQVRPQITGRLMQAHIQQGQEVTEGQLLYTIDPAPFKAALDKATAVLSKDQAQLAFSKKKVERYETLKEKDYVSALTYEQYQTDVATMTAQVASDQAEVDTATINLDYTLIYAPMSGKITQFLVDPGNLVAPTNTTPLTEIRQIDPIDIQFAISQADFQRLQERFARGEMSFDVLVPELTEPLTGGLVYFVDNHISLNTGTVLIKGRLDNASRRLWPGLFVRVRLLLSTKPNALLVPVPAVQYGQQGPYIYVVTTDQTVDLRKVTLGETIDNHLLIDAGISPGDVVVTDGQLNLRPGVKVQVIP